MKQLISKRVTTDNYFQVGYLAKWLNILNKAFILSNQVYVILLTKIKKKINFMAIAAPLKAFYT